MRSRHPLFACAALACTAACPRSAGAADYRGYLQADGELDAPTGSLGANLSALGGGWGFAFGLGLRGIPLMLGLRAGDVYVGGDTGPGPTVGVASSSGIEITSTTVSRRFELRHLEFTLRLEPPWMRFRPFIEASAGLAALWHVSTVDGVDGEIDRWEEQRSVAPTWGAAAGVDVLPWCKDYKDLAWKAQGTGVVCIGLTLGAGSWSIGSLDMGRVSSNPAGDQVVLQSASGTLHEWTFFAALTFAFEGARQVAAPPPPDGSEEQGEPDRPPGPVEP